MERKCFCDIHPVCYEISRCKEIVKRRLRDLFSNDRFAKRPSADRLPTVISTMRTHMIRRAPGVDLTSQLNKATNIRLASACINGVVIHPGEVFSFWHLVGNTTKRKGYKEGRVIIRNRLVMGIGGGLCNLANTLNRLILHSPLTVTEFHKHSDALAPDEGERIPLAAGTAVGYNYIDYRFKNETNQDFQIWVWCDGEDLCAELRAEHSIPCDYALLEEDHHFCREGNTYYRRSKLFRTVTDRATGELLEKELIWDNRSKVVFDAALIPTELLRM